jgi:hypothetical protein
MSKRIMIGLFALSVVAFLRTEANAGCAVIAGFQICASWITGGSEVGLVTTQGFADVGQSCSVVTQATTEGGFVAQQAPASPVHLKLAGTVPTSASPRCGIDSPNDQCDIRGVVFCGPPQPSITMTLPLTALTTDITTFGWPDHIDDDDDMDHPRARRAKAHGPLTADTFAPGQADGSGRTFSGFRFEMSLAERERLCPGREFITFIAREGFFEACVGAGPDRLCVRERCTVDANGIGPDDPRIYRCRPLSS